MGDFIKNRDFGEKTTKNYATATKKGHNTTKIQDGGHSMLNRYTRKNNVHFERGKRVYSNKQQRQMELYYHDNSHSSLNRKAEVVMLHQ